MKKLGKILVGILAALGLAAAAAVTYAQATGTFGPFAMGPGMRGSGGAAGPGMMGYGGGPRGGYGPGMMGQQDGARGYGPGMMGQQDGARGYGPGMIGPREGSRGYGPGMSGERRGPGFGARGGWDTQENGRGESND